MLSTAGLEAVPELKWRELDISLTFHSQSHLQGLLMWKKIIYPWCSVISFNISMMFSNILQYSVLFLNSCSMWLKQTFDEADKNGDGSLSISEVLQLMHKLNVNLPRQKVKQMFKVRIIFFSWKSKDLTRNPVGEIANTSAAGLFPLYWEILHSPFGKLERGPEKRHR